MSSGLMSVLALLAIMKASSHYQSCLICVVTYL